MRNNSAINDIKDICPASEWPQPSIDKAYVPISNEIIVDGIYSATINEDIVIVTEHNPSWFWSKEWQALEHEADEDIAKGRFTSHSSMEDFLADLND
jgi:hypothetical protein